MHSVKEISVLNNYHLKITFDDGLEKIINVRPFIGKGFTAELLDYEKFEKVFIEEGGGIAWENGFDFCPVFLRQMKEESLFASG